MRAMIFFILNFIVTPLSLGGTITAELDKRQGELGEAFQLILTITGKLKDELNIPEIKNATINQAGVSRNFQWINGQTTSEVQYSYTIIPAEPGQYTVPSIKVELDGQVEQTPVLTFQVTGQGSNHPNAGPPSTPSQSGGGPSPTDLLFIEREIPAEAPYVGEAILTTIKIYHRVRLMSATPVRESAPDFRIFSVPGEHNHQENRGGVIYQVIELRETILPLKSGDLELPPFSLNATYLAPSKRRGGRSGSVWDLLGNGIFNFGEEKTSKFTSHPQKIKVKPLPEKGKPADFQNLVGDFQLTANAAPRALKAGETTTISVAIEGAGALDGVGDIALERSDIGKVYKDKPEVQESVAQNGVPLMSKKIFRIALVPKSGTFDLGKVRVPVFNPRLGTYVTLEGDLGSISVQGSPALVSPPPQEANSSPAAVPSPPPESTDLRPSHPVQDLLEPHTLSVPRALVWLSALLITLFVTFGGLIVRFWHLGRPVDSHRQKLQVALKHLRKKITDAGRSQNHQDLAGLVAAIKDVVGLLTGMHGPAMTSDNLRDALKKLATPSTMLEDVDRLLSYHDESTYMSGKNASLPSLAPQLSALPALVKFFEAKI